MRNLPAQRYHSNPQIHTVFSIEEQAFVMPERPYQAMVVLPHTGLCLSLNEPSDAVFNVYVAACNYCPPPGGQHLNEGSNPPPRI